MTQSNLTNTVEARASWCPAVAPELPQQVPGWELTHLVAEGPLAGVYRARPARGSADRPAAYAVKVLHHRWREDPRAIAILHREATVGRTVSHRHLVSILAARVSQPPHYLVMPWLDGVTLAERLGQGVGVDLPIALWMARQVAEALQALDEAGWMHGDVKPSNILISPEGHVTLLDLGFARRGDETGSAVDRCVMGTFQYIAPEMLTSTLASDIRSDIYSLGAVLFETLSGSPPFEADDLAELASSHRQARAPDLRRLVPQLPTGVIRLVREMLSKEPLRRPQTPRELVRRLAALEIAAFSERS